MVLNEETARKTAELLLQINAIKLKPENPFTWASGWKSPIYCDNRIVLSFPQVRNYVRDELARGVETLYGKPDQDLSALERVEMTFIDGKRMH